MSRTIHRICIAPFAHPGQRTPELYGHISGTEISLELERGSPGYASTSLSFIYTLILDIFYASLTFSKSVIRLARIFDCRRNLYIQRRHPNRNITVTGIEIIHSSQNFGLTVNDEVALPDVGSTAEVVLKNWVPKTELTIEIGRKTAANIASVFMI
jgi:hypothetical protein